MVEKSKCFSVFGVFNSIFWVFIMFLVFLYRVGDRRCHPSASQTGGGDLQRCNGHIYLKMEPQAVRGAGQGCSKSGGNTRAKGGQEA